MAVIFAVDAGDAEAALRDMVRGREAAILAKGFEDPVGRAMKSLEPDIAPILERLGRGSAEKDEGWTRFGGRRAG